MSELRNPDATNLGSDKRMLPIRDVSERIGLSKSTIYAMIRDRQFPKPIKPRANTSRWLETEIADWCRAHIHRRDN
jgi:prophage regulatory protein